MGFIIFQDIFATSFKLFTEEIVLSYEISNYETVAGSGEKSDHRSRITVEESSRQTYFEEQQNNWSSLLS